jgi:hypothetical protein
MFLKIYHLNGKIKFYGFVKKTSLPKQLQQLLLNPTYKLYDTDNFFLHFYNGYNVFQYDESGDLFDHGLVEEGKIEREGIRKYIPFVDKSNEDDSSSVTSFDSLSRSVSTISDIDILPRAENDLDTFIGNQPYFRLSSENSTVSSLDSEHNRYEGEISNGIPHGKGILYSLKDDDETIHSDWSDTDEIPVYIGNFLDGQFHRKGIQYIQEKKNYIGNWKFGSRHGHGKSFDENGSLVFDGLWKKNKPYFGNFYSSFDGSLLFHGLFHQFCGSFSYYDNSLQMILSGNWRYGHLHGPGKLFQQGTLIYDGNFVNGRKHGNGCIYHCTGELYYEGEWIHDKRNGYGTEYLEWEIYKGQWKNDSRNGYGIEYLVIGEDKTYKSYSGMWKDNGRYGEGIDYLENGNILYEGEYKNAEEGFGRDYYENGNLKYSGFFVNGFYHGVGTFYYPDTTVCFEGTFHNGHPFDGIYYDTDGSTHRSVEKDGDIYTYASSIDNNEYIIYRGNFKNGKFHGEGTYYIHANKILYEGSFKQGKFDGTGTFHFKNGQTCSGDFINSLYVNTEKGTLEYLSFSNDKPNIVVFKGSLQNGKYYSGEEFLFEVNESAIVENNPYHNSYLYPRGSILWKEGKIFDEVEERKRIKKDLNILNYLETKNKRKLEKIYKSDYLRFLKEKYDEKDDELKKKNKKQLLNHIEKIRNNILSPEETISTEEKFDLFGNEIVNPVKGFDEEIYDESSMKYLFERNDENEFINISYSYDQKNNSIPNYPIMTNGKILNGYTRGKIKVYEYPTSRVETNEEIVGNLIFCSSKK